MDYFRNFFVKKSKDPVKNLKSNWKTFNKGYHLMLKQENSGAARKIMHSSSVEGALKEIVQIYIEEDQKENLMSEHLGIFE